MTPLWRPRGPKCSYTVSAPRAPQHPPTQTDTNTPSYLDKGMMPKKSSPQFDKRSKQILANRNGPVHRTHLQNLSPPNRRMVHPLARQTSSRMLPHQKSGRTLPSNNKNTSAKHSPNAREPQSDTYTTTKLGNVTALPEQSNTMSAPSGDKQDGDKPFRHTT